MPESLQDLAKALTAHTQTKASKFNIVNIVNIVAMDHIVSPINPPTADALLQAHIKVPVAQEHPHRRHLTRDQRLQVQTLRHIGHQLNDIARFLDILWRQAQYAASAEQVTPKKRSGRPSFLNNKEVNEIELYVVSSKLGRFMSFFELSTVFMPSIPYATEGAVRYALYRRGYRRYAARQKPPLSPKNIRERLEFLATHGDWTRYQ
ncbi:hypothetical protein BS50DRAFT_631060 [Corynespora cassiicola Philippines]|uniref:Transposase Tc1-like domain-containing protein n=1 Tax=Corynespora cassiicola Philippines TaxID=1448308 RepID=A0A2T2P024_CORCC|nr:hypothetical protein BS50DRAFT_631060 [Corynespora cassiicola Philippines]